MPISLKVPIIAEFFWPKTFGDVGPPPVLHVVATFYILAKQLLNIYFQQVQFSSDAEVTAPKKAKSDDETSEVIENVTGAEIESDENDCNEDINDIIVYKKSNGSKLETWTCNYCNCFFLEKVIILKFK